MISLLARESVALVGGRRSLYAHSVAVHDHTHEPVRTLQLTAITGDREYADRDATHNWTRSFPFAHSTLHPFLAFDIIAASRRGLGYASCPWASCCLPHFAKRPVWGAKNLAAISWWLWLLRSYTLWLDIPPAVRPISRASRWKHCVHACPARGT